MGFDRNVFVNCPFDDEYRPLLRPLLFTITYLGFEPRIALESLDSGRPRIEKIIGLIKKSKYAIHDLSRIKATKAGEYFRLNMPFELGIDVGCRVFRTGKWEGKKCLILEAERHRYQAAISDLSGSDIAVHDNKPVNVVRHVRNWLGNQTAARVAGPTKVWGAFNDFMADNYSELIGRGYSDEDIKQLPTDELKGCMKRWVASQA